MGDKHRRRKTRPSPRSASKQDGIHEDQARKEDVSISTWRSNKRYRSVATMLLVAAILVSLSSFFALNLVLEHDNHIHGKKKTVTTTLQPLASSRSRVARPKVVSKLATKSQRSNNPKPVPTELQYVHKFGMKIHDYFSASWLLPKTRFLDLNQDEILVPEDGCRMAYWDRKWNIFRNHAKMLVDWSDFNVEHLSRWWTIFHLFNPSQGKKELFPVVISFLKTYLKAGGVPTSTWMANHSLMNGTIVIIPFMSYHAKGSERKYDSGQTMGKVLTAHSLASTLKPLYEAGFGRVVVAGLLTKDGDHVRHACDLLNDIYNDSRMEGYDAPIVIVPEDDTNEICRIENPLNNDTGTFDERKHWLEIAFVQIVKRDWYKGINRNHNVPRGAIVGLQSAFLGLLTNEEKGKWLGQRNDWNYVHLTEADMILNINHEILPLVKNALDEGISLFPHRLHPLPHETDLPVNTTFDRRLFLPNVAPFSNVTTIDPMGNVDDDFIACCDGGNNWPGPKEHRLLGKWWETGFLLSGRDKKDTSREYTIDEIKERHKTLLGYKWMRMKNSVGVAFASNNNGRYCIPSKTSCNATTPDVRSTWISVHKQ